MVHALIAICGVLSAKGSTDTPNFAVAPLDSGTRKLYPHYLGHDLARLTEALARVKFKRDPYDTTKTARAKVDALGTHLLYGTLKVGSLFAVQVLRDLSYNPDNRRLNAVFRPFDFVLSERKERTFLTFPSLGADDDVFNFALPSAWDSTAKAGSYVGQNSFGVRKHILKYVMKRYLPAVVNSQEWGLSPANQESISYIPDRLSGNVKLGCTVEPKIAKAIMPRLRIIAVFRTKYPFVQRLKSFHSPTIDEPYEEDGETVILAAKIQEFLLYDFATGQILAKIEPENRKESKSGPDDT